MTTTSTIVQRILPAPFLVAADRLAGGVATDGLSITVDGPAGSRRVIGDLCAISFPATWQWKRRQGRAWLELTPVSLWRCELSITLDGAPRGATAHLQDVLKQAMERVERVGLPAPTSRAVASVRWTA
jgi:hypothetical protein